MRRTVNRIQPVGPPEAYTTWQIKQSPSTHYRTATCAEIECDAYTSGWVTEIDLGTRLGVNQADYIRAQSGRRFLETRTPAGMARFTFEAGQRCFASDRHAVPLDRSPFFYQRRGDWRRRLAQPRQYDRADQWVDDFATHTDKLKHQLEG